MIGMDDNMYYSLASSDENWTCFGCALPYNFSDSFLVRSPKDGELLGLEWGMIMQVSNIMFPD